MTVSQDELINLLRGGPTGVDFASRVVALAVRVRSEFAQDALQRSLEALATNDLEGLLGIGLPGDIVIAIDDRLKHLAE